MNMPMSFFNLFQRAEKQSEMSKHIVFLDKQVCSLVTELQATTDITTNTDSTSSRSYVGTPTKYNTYDKQVAQLGRLYDNTADWGCMIARNIIDVRTAFSVGGGIKVTKRTTFEGDATKELAWVKEFMRFNNLDTSRLQRGQLVFVPRNPPAAGC